MEGVDGLPLAQIEERSRSSPQIHPTSIPPTRNGQDVQVANQRGQVVDVVRPLRALTRHFCIHTVEAVGSIPTTPTQSFNYLREPPLRQNRSGTSSGTSFWRDRAVAACIVGHRGAGATRIERRFPKSGRGAVSETATAGRKPGCGHRLAARADAGSARNRNTWAQLGHADRWSYFLASLGGRMPR